MDGKRKLIRARLPGSSRYKVGEAVVVAKRMMAGVNKPGGQAVITAVSTSSSDSVYDVKYMLSSSTEKRLPEELLSVPEVMSSRTSSCASSSESRRATDEQRALKDENRRLLEEVEKLKWQNKQQRAAMVTLKGRVKERTCRTVTGGVGENRW